MGDDNFVRDLRTQSKSFSDSKALKSSDLIFWGANKTADLARVERLIPSLVRNGALWVVYPKTRRSLPGMESAAPRALGAADSIPGKERRVVGCLSQRQAGNYRASGAERRPGRWISRCEG